MSDILPTLLNAIQGAQIEILIFVAALFVHYTVFVKKVASPKQKGKQLEVSVAREDGNAAARSLSLLLTELAVETDLKISGEESVCEVRDLVKAAGPCAQLAVVQAAITKKRFDALRSFLALHPTVGQGFSQASLLKNLVRRNLLDEALHCIRLVSPTPAVYNAVLEALVVQKDIEKTREVIALVQSARQLDINGYNALIKVLASNGQMSQAREALSQISSFTLRPNIGSFHAILEVAVKGVPCDEGLILALLREMKAFGLCPNNTTCAIVAKSLQNGSPESYVKQVLQLVDSRLRDQPDDVLLGPLCEACNRSGYMQQLLPRLQQTRKKSGPLKLKCAHTVGYIIRTHGYNNDLAGVWETWREMKENQVQPSRITLGCMVEALSSNGEADSALGIINDALSDPQSKDLVNSVMYSSILKTYSQNKQFKRVWEVYQEMLDRGIEFSLAAFNTLLDACARSQEIRRAGPLLRAMSDQNITPNIITYGTVIKAYCSANQLEEAFKLLEDMQKSTSLVPDEVMFNTLMDGCARYGRFERGMKVLDSMRAAGIPPSNFTLAIVAKLASRSKQPEKAFEAVEQLQTEFSVKLNTSVFNNLIHAASCTRDLYKAKALVVRMISEKTKPDARTFSLLLRLCISSRAAETAMIILRAGIGLPQAKESSSDCLLQAALRKLPSRSGVATKKGPDAIPQEVIQDVVEFLIAHARKQGDNSLLAEVTEILGKVHALMPELTVNAHACSAP
eukprot:TRINITY_DN27244_c0_g4_i1.p1 TRINITY_DN27244_c0_g4~~TRINITY_DN27244_c0_g4_i1.p1  ORF type:complete len:739 (+),score=137.81 TRINITY_DN27244_c0_g4_i1:145-2361(+)